MNILNLLKDTGNRVLFPSSPKCSVCNRVLIHKDNIYCKECKDKLEWIGSKRCDICSRSMPCESYTNICENCEENENYFTQGYSLWDYDTYSSRIIKKIKYGGYEGLALSLGKVLYENAKDVDFLDEIDMIIPTPADKERFKKRGYNQAYLIAKGFSDVSNIEIRDDIIIKEKSTKDQIGLKEKERKANLKGAFKVINKDIIKSKTLLIVDDVLTTSSTINELSKTLIENNAEKIYFMVLCSKKNIN